MSKGNTSTYLTPLVLIFSEYNSLCSELVSRLLAAGCRPIVVSQGHITWKNRFYEDRRISLFTFSDWKDRASFLKGDYIIYIVLSSFGQANKKLIYSDKERISVINSLFSTKNTKKIFVFSYQQVALNSKMHASMIEKILSGRESNTTVIYIGNLTNGISGDNDYILSSLIKEAVKGRVSFVPSSFIFYPISSKEAARLIIRNLFSLRAWGKKVAIIGRSFRAGAIAKLLERNERKPFFRFKGTIKPSCPPVDLKDYAVENQRELVRRTISFLLIENKTSKFGRLKLSFRQIFLDAFIKSKRKIIEKPFKLINFWNQGSLFSKKTRALDSAKITKQSAKKDSFSKPIIRSLGLKAASLIFFALMLPVIVILLSVVLLKISQKAYSNNYLRLSEDLVRITYFSLQKTENYTQILSKLPFLGQGYGRLGQALALLEKEAEVGIKIAGLTKLWLVYSERIRDEVPYDPISLAKELKFDLDTLYQDLGFLEGEIENSDNITIQIAKKGLGELDISSFRSKVLLLSKLAENLPGLVGTGEPTKYVVVFQNSRHLRSTGGKIVSLAEVYFSGGKIIKIQAYSSLQADKNLLGLVDPPVPLKKYFGQGGWFIKEANWDPDFTISASQVEWFLDKQMDISVDGVIGIDTNYIKKALDIIGDIEIEGEPGVSAYNVENFFSKSEEPSADENESEMIASFSENFLKEILGTNDKRQRLILMRVLSEALEEKSVQVFVHQKDSARIMSALNWDGSIERPDCQSCYSDVLALTEISQGATSDRISRQVQLFISFEEMLIKRHLIVYIDNKDSIAYKAYLRVITPGESGFSPVVVKDGTHSEKIGPDIFGARGFKEAGVYIEISPRQQKAIEFFWESTSGLELKQDGRYELLLRKQAGILPYSLDVATRMPEGLKINSFSGFNLTEREGFIYNTILSKDIILKLSWLSDYE